jgi:DNA invertase Pin-like site-specific DNA recombinase
LIFHVFSALAQFERRLIQERTNAGLAAARIRGRGAIDGLTLCRSDRATATFAADG